MKLSSCYGIASVLLGIALLASCSSEDIPGMITPEPVPEETELDSQYQDLLSTTDEVFNATDVVNPSALASAVKSKDYVQSATEKDGVLIVMLKDGREIHLGLDVASSGPAQTPEEKAAQDKLMDEIVATYNVPLPSDDNADKSAPAQVEPSLSTTRSSAYSGVRYLKKNKILLFCPDTTLRSECVTRVKQAYGKRGNYAGDIKLFIDGVKAYGPDYFSVFSDFDLVVVGCHGYPDGSLYFPAAGMTAAAVTQWNQLVKTRGSGVYDATKTYEVGETLHGKKITERTTIKGYQITRAFFKENLPDLSKTIIWTVQCYSGENTGEFRYACDIDKNAADYFGADGECYGKEVFNIFDSYFHLLTAGRSSSDAFISSPDGLGGKGGISSKKLRDGVSYHRMTTHNVRYLKAEATGVRQMPKSRAGSEIAEDVLVGVRFRYDVDKNGNPTATTPAGIRLEVCSTGKSFDVPISSSNIYSSTVHKVDEGFVVNDLEIKLTGLEPQTAYRYRAYISAEEEVISDESFEFTTTEATDGIYRIYTRQDLVDFIMSQYEKDSPIHDRDVLLMNDVDLGVLERYYYTHHTPENNYVSAHPTFRNTFDGQGHTIKMSFGRTDGYDTYLYEYNAGTICNLIIEAETHNLKSPQDISRLFVENNTGVINNCHLKVNLDFDPSTPQEFRRVEDLFCYINGGIIKDCSLTGNIVGATQTWGLAVSYNSRQYINSAGNLVNVNGAMVNFDVDIDFDGKDFTGIVDSNYGLMKNVTLRGSIKTTYSAFGIAGANHSPDYGRILDCTNYASINAGLYAAGIVGGNSAVVDYCTNSGSIHCSGDYAAGIVSHNGGSDKGIIRNSVNSGTIYCRRYAAGICAENDYSMYPNGSSIIGCTNNARVTTLYSAGGIVAHKGSEGSVSGCVNNGVIRLDPTSEAGIKTERHVGTPTDGTKCLNCGGELYFSQISNGTGTVSNCTRNGRVEVPDDRCYKLK